MASQPVITQFNKQEYYNYLKVGKALKCTAEGLSDFAERVIKTFHSSLLAQHGTAVCSRPGIQKRVTKQRGSWSINCGCGVCGQWMRSIATEQATAQICWENTNVNNWPVATEFWQLAKPFMSAGKATSCNSPADTDPAGILQLLINCKKFTPLLDIQKVRVVRDIRNAFMHSADFAVKTPDMKAQIQDMITLLQEQALSTYQCATDAVTELRQIESFDLVVNDNAVLPYQLVTWEQKLKALDQKHQALDQQQQTLDKLLKAMDQQQRQKHQDHVEKLEKQKEDLARVEQNVMTFISEHEELKRHFAKELDSLKNYCDGQFTKQDGRFIKLEEDVQDVKEDIQDMKETLQKTVEWNAEEFLGKALREKYKTLTIPVRHSVDIDSDSPESLEDVFVEVHLQKYTTKNFPEKLSYPDLKEMETRVETNDAVQLDQLFCNLSSDVHKANTPTKVLLEGKPGVGKSTLLKYAANRWAKGTLWHDTKYTFLVPLKELELRPNESWSLSNLLLDGLIPPEHHTACIDVITQHPEEVMVILDGYDERRWSDKQQEQGKNEAVLSTLISRIISNDVLPGAKILVSSRPTKQLPVKSFSHTVQLCGFTTEMITEYVHKKYTKDEEFIMKSLAENPNMAGLCQVPLQCTFVCACLADRHTSAEMAVVNTTTDLYVQATVQMARKLHPHLKYGRNATDVDDLFDTIEAPLVKHADLARYGMLSSPPKFSFSKDDLAKFHFDESDKNCGFLVESQIRDPRLKGTTQSCWAFTHTTMQEFFGALGMLRSDDNVWEHLEVDTKVEQLKTMVLFLAGLLGDASHRYYVERLVARGATLDPDRLTHMLMMTRILTEMMSDDAMIIATIFETQRSDMVDIVPTDIASSSLSIMDMRALVWVLGIENFLITSLRLTNCQPDFMKQVISALRGKKSLHTLWFLEIDLSVPETGFALGATIATLPDLKQLVLPKYGIGAEAMVNVAQALQNCGQLKELLLQQKCGIGAEAMVNVAQALQHCGQLEELFLTGNDMSNKETGVALGTAISNMASLKILCLEQSRIGAEAMVKVAQALQHCGQLEVLCLTDNNMSDKETGVALGTAIRNMSSLKELDLRQCGIGAEAMVNVAQALQNCGQLEELLLTGNDISDKETGVALGTGISNMTSLKALGLRQCGIGAEAMVNVAQSLQHCGQLEILCLGGNDMSDKESGVALGTGIRNMASLKTLELQQCGIGAEAMVKVAQALQNCGQLEVLLLNCNDMSDKETGVALGTAISNMASLKMLCLQRCWIGTEGMVNVAQALQHCGQLELLALNGNDLTDQESGVALGTGIRNMTSLKTLCLGFCRIGSDAALCLARALSHCQKLENLVLEGNDFGSPRVTVALSESLASLSSLKELKLESCHLGNEGLHNVARGLSHCLRLEVLSLHSEDDIALAHKLGGKPNYFDAKCHTWVMAALLSNLAASRRLGK